MAADFYTTARQINAYSHAYAESDAKSEGGGVGPESVDRGSNQRESTSSWFPGAVGSGNRRRREGGAISEGSARTDRHTHTHTYSHVSEVVPLPSDGSPGRPHPSIRRQRLGHNVEVEGKGEGGRQRQSALSAETHRARPSEVRGGSQGRSSDSRESRAHGGGAHGEGLHWGGTHVGGPHGIGAQGQRSELRHLPPLPPLASPLSSDMISGAYVQPHAESAAAGLQRGSYSLAHVPSPYISPLPSYSGLQRTDEASSVRPVRLLQSSTVGARSEYFK